MQALGFADITPYSAPGSDRMPQLWAPREKELAAEALTHGKTPETCSLGSWDPGPWGTSGVGGLVPAWRRGHLGSEWAGEKHSS